MFLELFKNMAMMSLISQGNLKVIQIIETHLFPPVRHRRSPNS